MPEVVSAGELRVDLTQYLADLDKAGAAAGQLLTTVQAAGDATTAKFSTAAQAQVQFSEKLAGATAEVRNAQAATRSAADEVRRLAEANRELAGAQSGLSKTSAEYIRLKGLIAENTQKIKEAKAAINENRQAVEAERNAVQAVRDARREETNQTKLATAAAKDAAAAAKQQAQASGEAGQSGGFLSGVLGKAAAAFAGLFAINKLKEIAHDVVETTAEFERLEAVLTTINNGDQGKAERQFAELRAFTLRNPFEVKEVTEGYVTLRNVGINPTIDQLQSLADLAAASGKSFDTVTSSLLGATTGRFVQLKQFGITAKQQGDTVAFTFRGVTTVVEKTQQAISNYVFGLGQLNSVQGATERIMNTTGGRITNLKDSLTELFNVIGEGTDGPMNGFIKKLTQIATGVREALKSTDQKALDRLADTGALTNYGKVLDNLFERARANAKQAGTDIEFAIGAAAAQQANLLQKQLEKAQAAVNEINGGTLDATSVGRNIRDQFFKGEDVLDNPEANKRFEDELTKRKQRLALIQGEIGLVQERAAVAKKGNKDEADELGRINELKALIAANEKARDEALDTKEGNAERVRLIGLLKDERKELDLLMGKEETRRQKQAISYESQLRALLQERATLTSLAAKAAIGGADDAASRAKAIFDEALRQVDLVQVKLEQRERDLATAARKAGGSRAVNALGEKADGSVDGIQTQQLNTLRLAAADAYADAIIKIAQEREQRLFDLRGDSDQKELEQLRRHYLELAAEAKDQIERDAIEQARIRAEMALRIQREEKRLGQERAGRDGAAGVVGQVFGAGTGISQFEAERLERQKRLESERQFLEDSLQLNKSKIGAQAKAEKDQLGAQLLRVQRQQRALELEQKLAKFSIYKLIFGENDSPALRKALDDVAGSVATSLGSILQSEQQAAATKAGNATQQINELQSQLNQELAYRSEGSASNIAGLRAEIAEQKKVRKEALEEQRRAAQEQVIIDTLTQASSIATAAANVFATFSAIPFVGVPLGIAAAGLLVGAFAASKAQAFQAAGNIGKGFFTGGFTPEGGKYEEAGTVHKGEFVANQQLTRDYRPLFAALHEGQPQQIDWSNPKLAALLPDYSLPGKLREERQASISHHYHASMEPLRADLAGLRADMAHVKDTNQRMAERWDTHPTENGFMLINPETKSVHEITT